ncbi:hypothetical protein K4D18_003668 [Salmonella enterica subsp. diarizonae]|uniref:hypothetical protein n=1 Tax=Salmonella enterica TaxID=28901 RepID=UPI0009B02D7D|nr:hypothetical protein [Salmonella enterica]ECO1373276.1 hypothetical protein [Salmonella enterica subsp. diarizonae]EDT6983911.1 hypothetical protein [Salmonella enterica subsp. arizonae]EAR0004308.1 hypothetical protein [Salmonella enterica]EAW0465906.1 hypothetical protein [Salmonella enterica]EBP1016667.1 hypothetical protein [Salmonella enterica]
MKLSPEAKQAVKTAIEQLRLLLVDEDDVESLERLKKTFLHGAKNIIDGLDEKLKAQVAMLQTEKRPDNEAQEVEKVISDIMRIAASSELLRQLSRSAEDAQDGINLKRVKETFLQIACEVIAKERA